MGMKMIIDKINNREHSLVANSNNNLAFGSVIITTIVYDAELFKRLKTEAKPKSFNLLNNEAE